MSRIGNGYRSVDEEEFVQVQDEEGEAVEGFALGKLVVAHHDFDELDAVVDLALAGRPREGDLEAQLDLAPGIVGGLLAQTLGELFGLLVDEVAVQEGEGLGGQDAAEALRAGVVGVGEVEVRP